LARCLKRGLNRPGKRAKGGDEPKKTVFFVLGVALEEVSK